MENVVYIVKIACKEIVFFNMALAKEYYLEKSAEKKRHVKLIERITTVVDKEIYL